MRTLRLFSALAIPFGLMAQSECLTVTGGRILGSDMARAVPAFAKIPKTATFAPAPAVGGAREFSVSDLRAIAAHYEVTLPDPKEICFRFAMEAFDRGKAEAAMRQALQSKDARLEILDTSSGPVPAGVMEFTREGLGVPSSPGQPTGEMWRGDIIYAGSQRYPVWARVRVTVPTTILIATDALRPGTPIRPEQVRTETTDRFPQPGVPETGPDEIAGMAPLRSVAPGAEIRRENLVRPNDVNRGDVVQVEVHFGAAHLALSGRAESGGHIGDIVSVRNLETSKLFQARVDEAGRVFVGTPAAERVQTEGY